MPGGIIGRCGGGGGSTVAIYAGLYGGSVTTVNAGVNAFLPVDVFSSGDDLLDLTTPLHPTAKIAGLWTVAMVVNNVDGMPAGVVFDPGIRLRAATTWSVVARSAPPSATWTNMYVPMTASRKLAIGDFVEVTCANQDVAAHTYAVNGMTVAVTAVS